MSVTVRQSSSFHILTSIAQVDADIRKDMDIISLLLLGNDVASAEAFVADNIIPSTLNQDQPLAEMSEIRSIKAMIRNWVGYEYRPSPKQLMMACMLLLEVTRRCPESRKKLATL